MVIYRQKVNNKITPGHIAKYTSKIVFAICTDYINVRWYEIHRDHENAFALTKVPYKRTCI